jgi:transglutaminase-like putative cysteine protease
VPKAIALAAVARAVGVPARIGFADLRNHLTSPKFAALMDDELFRWHAYTALFLEGRWVKATPAFDLARCQRHGVKPLEFDGCNDSIFHEFNPKGRRHMEYSRFFGEYDDLPFEAFTADMRKAYPRMLAYLGGERAKKVAAPDDMEG